MPEFSKIFDLPAAKLSREDVEALARLITDGVQTNPKFDDFSVSRGDVTYRASSIDELLSQDLPSSVDSLSISVDGWTADRSIDRSVRINLQRTYAHCQISAKDEIWYNGKIKQINNFFAKHRRWYGKYRMGMSGLFAIFGGISVALTVEFLVERNFLFALAPALALTVLLIGSFSQLKGNLFPHIEIQLARTRPLVTGETLMIILMVIGIIVSVLGVVLQLLPSANS